jgi:hypothetical protein
MDANRISGGTAFKAAPLIKPPALLGVSDLLCDDPGESQSLVLSNLKGVQIYVVSR